MKNGYRQKHSRQTGYGLNADLSMKPGDPDRSIRQIMRASRNSVSAICGIDRGMTGRLQSSFPDHLIGFC
jgi:hypothetical protein